MRWLPVVIGVVLLVGGLFLGIAISVGVRVIYDPVADPVATIKGTSQVELEKGEYEIWIDESDPSGYLEIRDPQGNEVETENPSIAPSQKGYMMDLTFKAEMKGTYLFERNDDTPLYIMEPQSNKMFFLQLGPCCGGMVLALIGLIVLVVGLLVKKKKHQ